MRQEQRESNASMSVVHKQVEIYMAMTKTLINFTINFANGLISLLITLVYEVVIAIDLLFEGLLEIEHE